jgi:hypothetical protein
MKKIHESIERLELPADFKDAIAADAKIDELLDRFSGALIIVEGTHWFFAKSAWGLI